ncbi:hypothetical protein AB0K40_19855 [Nonomuraea bangladeshensis]|uniref:Uncharacterized protein n=1 Tax=Nonomuraea bangladeshensis TaxID=404385 RepID=A0ABV3H5H7_9ACTN
MSEMRGRLSPIAFEHIDFVLGRYVFTCAGPAAGLRPLHDLVEVSRNALAT